MKKILIAAAAASVMIMPMLASASDYDRGMYGTKASPGQSGYIHQMTFSLHAPAESAGGVADFAGMLPVAAADSGSGLFDPTDIKTMIGGADFVACSNPVVGIDAGSSNKADNVLGVTVVAANPEVGWKGFPHSA